MVQSAILQSQHILNFYDNNGISTIESLSSITYTGLTYNDYIEVIATPYVTGGTLHDNRQFQVLNVTDNKIQVREYIIPESGYTYTINKVINKKKIRKLYCQQNAVATPSSFSGYTVCYSTSNKITLTQSILPSGSTSYFYENTISAMRNKYKTLLDRYGLNLYHYNMGLPITSLAASSASFIRTYIQTFTEIQPTIAHITPLNVSPGDYFRLACQGRIVSYTATTYSITDVINGMIKAIDDYRILYPTYVWATDVVSYINKNTYLEIGKALIKFPLYNPASAV